MLVNCLRPSQISSAVLPASNALIQKTILCSAKDDSINVSAIFHTCPEKMSCEHYAKSTADTPFAFEAVLVTNNKVIYQAIC